MKIIIEEINHRNIEKLKKYLKNIKIASNFVTYQQLYAFTHCKTIYLIKFESLSYLLIKEKFKEEYVVLRLLFQNFTLSKKFVDKIISIFNPDYFVVNISTNPNLLQDSYSMIRHEYCYRVFSISNTFLISSALFKKYKTSNLINKNIRHVKLNRYQDLVKYVDKIRYFLKIWKGQVRKNPVNDIFFWENIALMENLNVDLYFCDENIIGLSLYVQHPNIKSLCVSIFNKNLRGYRYLGEFIKVNQAKNIYHNHPHIKYVLVGGRGVDSQFQFKKQFLENGKLIKTYSYELINKINFNKYKDLKTRDKLLVKVWC